MARKGEPNSEVWDCRLIENARKQNDTMVNPIFNWTDKDVWEYIHDRNIKYNPLYDMGYKRVGCVGCPMSNRKGQLKWFNDFPKYKELYISFFDKMLMSDKVVKNRGWQNGKDVFEWWIKDNTQIKGQMSLFDDKKE